MHHKEEGSIDPHNHTSLPNRAVTPQGTQTSSATTATAITSTTTATKNPPLRTPEQKRGKLNIAAVKLQKKKSYISDKRKTTKIRAFLFRGNSLSSPCRQRRIKSTHPERTQDINVDDASQSISMTTTSRYMMRAKSSIFVRVQTGSSRRDLEYMSPPFLLQTS